MTVYYLQLLMARDEDCMAVDRGPSGLVGMAFTVTKPDLHFPRAFTVLGESAGHLHLQNDVETYWVSKGRFRSGLGERFTQATGKKKGTR